MPFPTLNERLHHHKPYPSTWAQVSAVLQKSILTAKQKASALNSRRKTTVLPLRKKLPAPPTPPESKYSSSHQTPSG